MTDNYEPAINTLTRLLGIIKDTASACGEMQAVLEFPINMTALESTTETIGKMTREAEKLTEKFGELSKVIEDVPQAPEMASSDAAKEMAEGFKKALDIIGEVVNTTGELNDSLGDSTQHLDEFTDAAKKAKEAQENVANSGKKSTEEQSKLSKAAKATKDAVENVGKAYKEVKGQIDSAIKSAKSLYESANQYLTAFDTQINAEVALYTNLVSNGGTDAFDTLRQQAKDIASGTMFTDQVLLTGAAQLSRIDVPGSPEMLLPVLADYSAVMSGGKEITGEKMTEYATHIVSAFQGSYDEIEKMGIKISDADKELLKTADSTQRLEIISGAVHEKWGGMSEVMSNLPQGQIVQIKQVFGELKEDIGAQLYPAVLRFVQALKENMPMIETILQGAAGAMSMMIDVAAEIIGVVSELAGNIIDNWDNVVPVILGVAGALMILKGIMLLVQIGALAMAAAKAVSTAATLAATAAAWLFSGALWASPVTVIILAVIALVGVIFGLVAAFNKATGSSVSALGLIAGAFGALIAFIVNTFVLPFYNMFAILVNFFANVFNAPIETIKATFFDLVSTVLGYFSKLAHGIEDLLNKIPGVNVSITSGIDNLYNSMKQAAQTAKDNMDFVEILETKDFLDIAGTGESFYQGTLSLEESMGGLFSGGEGLEEDYLSKLTENYTGTGNISGGADYDTMPGNTGAIADNTAAIKDSVEVTGEDLKYLKDLAEAEAVNRFTTAEIKLDITNNNNISKEGDIDGILSSLSEEMAEALLMSAEGVHV